MQDGLNEELEVVLSHTVSQNCFGTGLNVHVIQTILNNAETAHRTVFVFRHLFVSLAFIIRGNAAASIGNRSNPYRVIRHRKAELERALDFAERVIARIRCVDHAKPPRIHEVIAQLFAHSKLILERELFEVTWLFA